MDPSDLMCHSLSNIPIGQKIARILASGVNAVDPSKVVASHLKIAGNHLLAGDRNYDLTAIGNIFLIGIGKGAVPMSQAVVDILGENVSSGLVITKDGYGNRAESLAPIRVIESGHPLPDERAIQATQQVCEMLSATAEEDLVIVVISGGASALFTRPVSELSLSDLQYATNALLKCGASINEINTIRKHLDSVKGGGLASKVYPAKLLSLVLSDVVGNHLDIIASGPTVPDSSTYLEAQKVLVKYHLEDIPKAVINILTKGINGDIPETPKAGSKYFERVQNLLVGTNEDAINSALEQAKIENISTQLLTASMQGEARHVGVHMARQLLSRLGPDYPMSRPFCLIAGGETTVTVRGDGKGGRNQELALAAVEELKDRKDIALVTLATDGGDGPTDAAGAVVTGETYNRARGIGMEPSLYLDNNDSYVFFEKLNDNLKPGPSQTNVNDLVLLFAF